MGRAVGVVVLRAIGWTMVAGALAVAIAPRPVPTPYRRWIVIAIALAAIALALVAPVPRWVRGIVSWRWTAPAVALVGGVVSTLAALGIRYPYGWDARVIMDIAQHVSAGTPLPPWRYHYLSLYPNNFALVAIDRLGVEVGAALGIDADDVLIVLNGMCLTITLWLVHLTVRRAASSLAAVVAMLLVLVLVGLSPWMAVPYTDIYGMVFLAAVPVLASRAWSASGWSRWAAWLGAVLCAAIAYVIKTTPAVIVAAGVLVILIRALPARLPPGQAKPAAATGNGAWPARRLRGTVCSGVLVAALTVTGFLTLSAAGTSAARAMSGVDLDQVDPSQSPPLVWWVANGMNLSKVGGLTRWGAYSRPMVRAIDETSRDEDIRYAEHYIATSMRSRGALGMLRFYANKTVWNWSDAMFWAWSEGIDSTSQPYETTPTSRWLMDVNGFHGSHYVDRSSATQGLWIALVLLSGIGLLRARPRPDVLLLALTTLGIGVFIVIFQGRSRYLLAFVPIIAALGGTTAAWLPRRVPRRRAGIG